MNVTISYKNVKHSEAVEDQIKKKSEKIDKYFKNVTNIHWTCFKKDGVHHADLKVLGPQFEYFASSSHKNLYKSFDEAVCKLEKQVKKKHDKWKNRIHEATGIQDLELLEPEAAWGDYDEDEFDDVG